MSLQAARIEFPTRDVEHAAAFYGALFDVTCEIADDGTRRTAILTADDDSVGISVNQTADFEPGSSGTYACLLAGEDLTERLGRVEKLGGTVLVPRTLMEGAGYYATVRDTEGNAFALCSPH